MPFFWEIDKIGYTRVVSEQNRVPFFSRRGALTHVCKTPPKHAFWRLNPLRLVCAQHPKPFFRCSTLKTAPMTAPKKCSPRTTRFCSGTHRVYPALCFDFINHPILFIPHPILFNFARPAETRKRTSPVNPARKIFHTTGKLPTVTTVMQPQQHC